MRVEHADDGPTVLLRPNSPCPPVCITCGAPTHRRVRMKTAGEPRPASSTASPVETAIGCVPYVGCLYTLVMAVIRATESRRPTLTLRVPQCRECGRDGNPYIVRAYFDQQTAKLQAHRRFAEALDSLRLGGRAAEAPSRGEERRR